MRALIRWLILWAVPELVRGEAQHDPAGLDHLARGGS
jgi:hypothetical protein